MKQISQEKSLTFVRGFYNLAKKWEIPGIEKNPDECFDFAEENNKIERYLTKEESTKLIEQVKKSDCLSISGLPWFTKRPGNNDYLGL